MQPYFLPYLGYFQLIAAVDAFVVYDTIKHTKKGWINRNRLLRDGADAPFTLPLAAGSDHLDVVQRQLAPTFDREKLLRQFRGAYARAPHFASAFPLVERVVRHPDDNLFRYLLHAIRAVCGHLAIATALHVASAVPANHALRGQERVLAICEALGATTYLNPPGGRALYDAGAFAARGIRLEFLEPRLDPYPQFGAPFVPALSIVDVLMFNALADARAMVFRAAAVA
ncbi:MAG: WbqC family protein [Gemmatimonadetes bacterium]|nr:WbqC family protein [Gemmatimonadota bacterium]